MKFTSTNKLAETRGVKILVYSKAGAGKTVLCSTAPVPLILSCESGLLSLRSHNIPVILIDTEDDLLEAYEWIANSDKAKRFKTICLDSISEMGERVLASRKLVNKDQRKAYAELNEAMDLIIKRFRDLDGFNVYFSAKEKVLASDEDGISRIVPAMPGTALMSNLPYLFDCVMHLRVVTVGDNKKRRYLLTESDYKYEAKDRSGVLAPKEPANLAKIFDKISSNTGVKNED